MKRNQPTPAATNGAPAPAPKNPILPDNLQGSAYKVIGFNIQPVLSIRDKNGMERGQVVSPTAVRAFESQFFVPMPKIIKGAGLAMESSRKK